MAKIDPNVDYYGLLGIDSSVNDKQIREAYKKEALKCHPDRNINDPDGAKEKFQQVQIAYEILSDAAQKTKYDKARSRRGASSSTAQTGPRYATGNPWADTSATMSSMYGAPPRRPPAPTRPMPSAYGATTGSRRDQGAAASARQFFSTRNPKSPPRPSKFDFEAWERMRPSGSSRRNGAASGEGPSSANPPASATPRPTSAYPDPPPGRTNTQRQTPFGTSRKPGFASADLSGDESPRKSRPYTTSAHSNMFADMSANTKKARDPPAFATGPEPASDESAGGLLADRRSTPYMSHIGEKTNPFEGISANRTKTSRKSSKDTETQDSSAPAQPRRRRQRSVSVDNSDRARFQTGRSRDADDGPGAHSPDNAPFSSTAFWGDPGTTTSAPATATFPGVANHGPNRSSPHVPGGWPSGTSQSRNGANSSGQGPNSQGGAAGPAKTPNGSSSLYATSSSPHPLASAHTRIGKSQACPEPSGVEAPQGSVGESLKKQAAAKPESKASKARESAKRDPPSGASLKFGTLYPYEVQIYSQIKHLLGKNQDKSSTLRKGNDTCSKEAGSGPGTTHGPVETKQHGHGNKNHSNNNNSSTSANAVKPGSFHSPPNLDGAPRTSPPGPQPPLSRNSTDNINTRFVAEDKADSKYQFNAGASDDDAFLRAKQRSRTSPRGRRSYTRTNNTGYSSSQESFGHVPSQAGAAAKKPASSGAPGFDAEQWAKKIGRDDFVPPVAPRPPASPTRAARQAKKPSKVKTMAGNAGLVESDEMSGDDHARSGVAPDEDMHVASPMEMDIDSPLLPGPDESSTGRARNKSLEPSRPEWRAGDAKGVSKAEVNSAMPDSDPNLATNPLPKASTHVESNGDGAATSSKPATVPVGFAHQSAGGSEDNPEFMRMSGLNKVEPFAKSNTAAGLSSMTDLQADLPWDSRPAAKLPRFMSSSQSNSSSSSAATTKRKALPFPDAPIAPRPPMVLGVTSQPQLKPPVAQWIQYADQFKQYMAAWHYLSARVTDHFVARMRALERQTADLGDGLGWIDTLGDAPAQGPAQYCDWLEEDEQVRRKWQEWSDAHKRAVSEYVACRERMRA